MQQSLLRVAAALTLATLLGSRPAMADPVLVTSADIPIDSLTKAQAKKIWSGQTPSWPDGSPLVLVLPPKKGDSDTWLAKNVVKMPIDVHRRYLLEKAFAATIPAPLQAKSDDETTLTVLSTPGSIGVAPSEALPEGLKVLTIE